MQDQLKHWRGKISSNSQEWEDRNASLLAEKKSMSRHYQSLKGAMDSFRGAQGERLKQLCLQAQGAEHELHDVIHQAEGLLKLAEMCRGLETEQVRRPGLRSARLHQRPLHCDTASCSDAPVAASIASAGWRSLTPPAAAALQHSMHARAFSWTLLRSSRRTAPRMHGDPPCDLQEQLWLRGHGRKQRGELCSPTTAVPRSRVAVAMADGGSVGDAGGAKPRCRWLCRRRSCRLCR